MYINNEEDVISKENIQDILDNLDIGYFKGVFKGKLLIHNTAINKILGIDPLVDLTGSHSSQFFSDSKVLKSYYNELSKNGYVKDFIAKIKTPKGELIYIRIDSHLIKEDNGKNTLIEGIVTNVTEKYILEQNLKNSEEKYRNLIENTHGGIWALDENENTIFVNQRMYEMLGYTKNEMIGKNLHFFIPESMEPLIEGNRSKREKGIKETYEILLLKKDGSTIYTEISAAPIMDEYQKYKGSFAYITDITSKKIAEQKLIESENKYRTLFESSTDGIFSTDMEGLFIEVNEAFLKMTGYSRSELLELKNRQITPSKWYENEDNMLFTHLAEGESKVYEKEFILKNGNILPVSIRFWILQDEQGDPHRIWAIVRDITESKKMEKKLKEINRLKSEFLSRASHELKTPLVSIKGYTDLILTMHAKELKPEIISKLKEVDKGCVRLQKIINDLLRTSKVESPNLKPKLEKEDLSFLINFCVNELYPLAVKRGHSLNIEIHESIITRFAKEEIHDVLANLLTNAIKYTPPSGWIDIKTDLTDNFVIVTITDNGIGFTKEEKDRIFKQFGKIERYGQGLDLGIDGTGLGLHISKKIIESHGGEIWMESEGKDKGSTFYFSLPLDKD